MKNIFVEEREVRQPKLIHALITFGGLIAVMAVGIIVFEVDPHIPMFIGVIISAVMAMYLGYNWSQIEKMMVDGKIVIVNGGKTYNVAGSLIK